MKNVLLMVHPDREQEARFQAALDLARALDGHLTCLEVFVPLPIVEDPSCGGAAATLIAEQASTLAQASARVRERLAIEDVPWDWIGPSGPASDGVAAEAGLADVIVSSHLADRMFDRNLPRLIADVAAAANQPLVAVPASSAGVDWHGRALVAWDGSAAAMAALRGAAPIISLAADVELLEIDDRCAGPPAEVAARYLSRHGVPSTIERIHSLQRPTASLIEDRAAAIGAAFVVMGAYGHNRARELFFGGVTRSMMRGSRFPLVLAH